jgi:hypothetical protein
VEEYRGRHREQGAAALLHQTMPSVDKVALHWANSRQGRCISFHRDQTTGYDTSGDHRFAVAPCRSFDFVPPARPRYSGERVQSLPGILSKSDAASGQSLGHYLDVLEERAGVREQSGVIATTAPRAARRIHWAYPIHHIHCMQDSGVVCPVRGSAVVVVIDTVVAGSSMHHRQALALLRSLHALADHGACNYPIERGETLVVEVRRVRHHVRRIGQVQREQNVNGVVLEEHGVVADRSPRAHMRMGELASDCCSSAGAQEGQWLDPLGKRNQSMVPGSAAHHSPKRIFGECTGPWAAG